MGSNYRARHTREAAVIHVHVSPVEFLSTAAYVVLFGFLWRTLSARWSDNAAGQAMAFIF